MCLREGAPCDTPGHPLDSHASPHQERNGLAHLQGTRGPDSQSQSTEIHYISQDRSEETQAGGRPARAAASFLFCGWRVTHLSILILVRQILFGVFRFYARKETGALPEWVDIAGCLLDREDCRELFTAPSFRNDGGKDALWKRLATARCWTNLWWHRTRIRRRRTGWVDRPRSRPSPRTDRHWSP